MLNFCVQLDFCNTILWISLMLGTVRAMLFIGCHLADGENCFNSPGRHSNGPNEHQIYIKARWELKVSNVLQWK
jgi:hypothetical protein